MNADSETLLTVREVAERLRLSQASVYQMVKSGRLAVCRLGPRRGAIRIRESDLEACLESSEQMPAAARSAKEKHVSTFTGR